MITIIDDLLRHPITESEERFFGDPRAFIYDSLRAYIHPTRPPT